ncbi:MAG: response regulator [Verrucomicrobiota bacterium]
MTQSYKYLTLIKVLLVEDNPGDARLVSEFLEEARPGSFRVANVGRVSTAEAALASGDFDVILLDLTLPDANGIETYRKMAALTGNKRIVVLTGLEDLAVENQLMGEGAYAFIRKRQLHGLLLAGILRNAAAAPWDK